MLLLHHTSFLLELPAFASAPGSMATSDPHYLATPLQVGLTLLRSLLQAPALLTAWNSQPRVFTYAVYKSFQDLFEIFLSWINVNSRLLAAADAYPSSPPLSRHHASEPHVHAAAPNRRL